MNFKVLVLQIILFYRGFNCQDVDCQKISEAFVKGMKIFDFEEANGKYLADNGFLNNVEDPFHLIFGSPPLEFNMTNELTNAKYAVRGSQMLSYLLTKPLNGNRHQIMDFFKTATECNRKELQCPKEQLTCDSMSMIRSLDGTCNNLEMPKYGAAMTKFSRLLRPKYDDNVYEPRKDFLGKPLKSPRIVTDKIYTEPQITMPSLGYTQNMGWYFFGQLLAHDVAGHINIDHGGQGQAIRCCSQDFKTMLPKSQSHHSCMPFEILPGDKYFSQPDRNYRCHNYIRSQQISEDNCTVSASEQINLASHFIDLSVIYSLSTEKLGTLRTFSGGALIIDEVGMVLPKIENCETKQCYFTGDFRVGQTSPLAVWHSLFVRMHNVIAKALSELNGGLDDNSLFEEARKINIALYQQIIYMEYVPAMLGERVTFSGSYDPTVDPATLNEFSTGAFRFLHIYTPDNIEYFDKDMQIVETIRMADAIGDTSILETRYDDVVRGLLFQNIPTNGFGEAITNNLFNGMDVAAVDIQRGRDHGLQPYLRYRELCGMKQIQTWKDLFPSISKSNIQLLKAQYGSIQDIDLYVGGSLEQKTVGSTMGPTFTCISKMQFTRYKDGDRFFYSNNEMFTQDQLIEIQNFSLAKLLCTVTMLEKVQRSAFYSPSYQNEMAICAYMPKTDFSKWKM